VASTHRIPPQPALPLRDDLTLTYVEAAAYLRATPRQVRRWVSEGRLGCRRLNQRKTLILGRHIREFLEAGEERTADPHVATRPRKRARSRS
jgi:excisionase family DNA binding protein